MRFLILLTCSFGLSLPAQAQQTLLTEDFDSGVVPPAGWSELNNGATLGWETDATGSQAEHDDFSAGFLNENRLLSPSVDASAVTALYLHAQQDQQFPAFRDRNAIEVSLDGGMSFVEVWQETSTLPFSGGPIEVDLSAYAGMSDVRVSFAYEGDYANIWRVDDIVLDDQAPTPVLHWPALPSAFVDAEGYRQDFEALAGTVPAHMALNELDSATRQVDPGAWCNIGNRASSLEAYNGNYSLEMGLEPGATDFRFVSNAMILGLRGAPLADLRLSFQATSYGEEAHADDGVFLSLDGLDWVAVASDWTQLVGLDRGDQALVVADLRSSGLNLDGDFYLAIAQQDDFPYADLDGLRVDEITIGLPVLELTELIPNQVATLQIRGARAGSEVTVAYSPLPGPLVTPYGNAGIGLPYIEVGTYIAGAQGEATDNLLIPPLAAGATVWVQALELVGLDGRFSNVWRIDI